MTSEQFKFSFSLICVGVAFFCTNNSFEAWILMNRFFSSCLKATWESLCRTSSLHILCPLKTLVLSNEQIKMPPNVSQSVYIVGQVIAPKSTALSPVVITTFVLSLLPLCALLLLGKVCALICLLLRIKSMPKTYTVIPHLLKSIPW